MRNILITGCSGGLGSALKSKLINKKFKVYTHSRNGETDINADFTEDQEVEKIKKFIFDNKISYLINNSGTYCEKQIQEVSNKEINQIIKINLTTPIILSKYIYQFCLEKNIEGLIVNINSLAGKYPNFNESIYCASKFGLTGFSSCLSMNQKKSNVKVIDCHIGAMKTNMTNNRENQQSMMDPDKVADFLVDIIVRRNEYILSSFELRNNK